MNQPPKRRKKERGKEKSVSLISSYIHVQVLGTKHRAAKENEREITRKLKMMLTKMKKTANFLSFLSSKGKPIMKNKRQRKKKKKMKRKKDEPTEEEMSVSVT